MTVHFAPEILLSCENLAAGKREGERGGEEKRWHVKKAKMENGRNVRELLSWLFRARERGRAGNGCKEKRLAR